MIYQTYQPQSLLSQFVELLWNREGENLPKTQSRLLPIGSMELVINLNENRVPLFDHHSRSQIGSTNGMMICGVHSESFIINNDSQISMMGVHFKPGGNPPFFALPAGELHNQRISLDELWQGRAAELRDRLLASPTVASRFGVLEQFLLMVMKPLDRYAAIAMALQEFRRDPTTRVSEVTDKIGFSTRHFNQLFRDQVGLTPKLFCRVRRLQQALDLLSGKDQVDWADVAIACGYFDQAHFIHDFRSLANDDVTVVGVAWFHPDQWQKLRTVVPKLDELHDTYQEWLEETESLCLKLQNEGGVVHRVEVDIDDLIDWCREHNRIPDASGRSEYAADRIQKLYNR